MSIKHRLGLLMGLLAGGLLVAIMWREEPTESATSVRGADPTTTQAIARDDVDRQSIVERSPVLAAPLASRANQPTATLEQQTQPTEIVIRGRCLAAESGLPLSGCQIRLQFRSFSAQTGDDGRFELRLDRIVTDCELAIHRFDRVERTVEWDALRLGQVEELGDISLVRGMGVKGQVVDMTGTPVAGIEVHIEKPQDDASRVRQTSRTASARSDPNGNFAIAETVGSGTWRLSIATHAFDLVTPHEVSIVESNAPTEVRIVVRARRSIAGIVVDEHGRAVPGLSIGVRAEGSDWTRRISSSTREDGRFAVYALDGDPDSVQLANTGPGGPLADDRFFTWGAKDVRLELRRGNTFELTVVEAGSDRPVEEFAVKCHASEGAWSNESDPRLSGHHPGGQVTVDRVHAGKNVLRVIPADPALAMSEELEFDATESGAAAMRVEVARMTPLHVRVVRAGTGEPVASTEIEILQARGAEVSADRMVVENLRGTARAGGFPLALLLSSTTTDALGMGTLYGPRDVADLALRVLGPGHLPLVRSNLTLPSIEDPLVIEVGRGGSLRGTLTGPAPLAYDTEVRVEPLADASLGTRRQHYPVGSDGSFLVALLAPGAYEVVLSFRTGSQVRQAHNLLPPLGSVRIEEGRETSVTFDTSAFAPAKLEARLTLDREPLRSARVWLHGDGGSHALGATRWRLLSQWSLPLTRSDTGTFVVDVLPPGTYRFALKWSRGFLVGRPFTLAPGQTLARTFEFASERLRIRLLDPDGKPLADTDCRVWADHEQSIVHGDCDLRTDHDGWITLDPAPGIPVLVYVRTDAGGEAGPVAMPEGQSDATVELRIRR